MADEEKKSSGGANSGVFAWIIIILILLAAGEALNSNKVGVLSSSSDNNTQRDDVVKTENPINGTSGGSFIDNLFSDNNKKNISNNDESVKMGFFTKIFPKGDISLGNRIILLEKQNIRRNAAGGIIGDQEKLSKGFLKEGPITSLGRSWWRVDFDDAPDGWVDQSFISSKVKTFIVFNIIPIIFSNIRMIALFLILIFLTALGYLKFKENKINNLEKKKKQTSLEFSKQKNTPNFSTGKATNKDWENVTKYVNSPNENDWRQAIIEADIMLDTMLTKIGYAGETVAEKLKNVEESDFTTLQKAWEAHKIRNRIAHDGSKFKINHAEAERVVKLFEQVFKEFYYI